jgi:hypothetical protein
MDLSKLPRLSKTPTVPAEAEAPPTMPAEGAGVPMMPCPCCKTPIRVGARFCDSCGAQLSGHGGGVPGAGPEAWIGIGIGLLLLLVVPNIVKLASSKIFHTQFAPYIDPETNQPADYVTMTDGSRIAYTKQITFWSDLAVTAFAVALIFDGIVLLVSRKPAAVLLAFAISVLATLANFAYFVGTYSTYGLALISLIAVPLGLYMAFYQWKLFQAVRGS